MPAGGLARPGTGGAPPRGGPAVFVLLSMIGADLSFVTVFLSRVPFEMSESSSFCDK